MRTALLAPLSLLLGCFSPSALDLEETSSTGDTDAAATETSANPTTGTTATPPPPDESTGADGSDPTGDPPSTTGAECRPGHACVTGAPVGWVGPGVLHEDGQTPCTGVFPVEGARGATAVEASAAGCSCSCAPDTTATCSSLAVTGFNDATCSSGGSVYSLDAEGCTTTGNNVSVLAEPAELDPGFGCEPTQETQLSAASLTDAQILCLPEGIESSCGRFDACLEQTPEGQYCIAHAGDVPCPENTGYSERVVLGSTIQDDRACGSCTCGPQEGTCETTLWQWGGSSCNGGPPVEIATDGTCVETGLPSATITIGAAEGSCTPSAGAPEGEATLVPETTVCCGAFG